MARPSAGFNFENGTMRKWRHAWNETYRVNVYMLCCKRAEYERAVLSEFNSRIQIEAGTDGRFVGLERAGMTVGTIWVNSELVSLKRHGCLTHELFHLVAWVMDGRGIDLHEASEEAWAYLLEFFDRAFRRFV